MNFRKFLFFLFLSFSIPSSAQDLDWVLPFHTNNVHISSVHTTNIETTSKNEIVVVIKPHQISLSSVQKIKEDGNLMWRKEPKSEKIIGFFDLKCDSSNNIYLTGFFTDFMIWEADTIVSNGRTDFVIKLNEHGEIIWLRKLNLAATHIMIKPDQSVVLWCHAFIKNPIIENLNGNEQLHLDYEQNYGFLSYSPEGNYQWHRFHESLIMGHQFINCKITDNEIYVFSPFRGEVDVETGSGKTVISGNTEAKNYYLAKYDLEGNFDWVEVLRFGGNYVNNLLMMDVSQDGNILISGSYEGNVNINFKGEKHTLKTAENRNWFMASYDPSLKLIWSSIFESPMTWYTMNLKAHKNNIYLYGNYISGTDLDPSQNEFSMKNKGCFFAEYKQDGSFSSARVFPQKQEKYDSKFSDIIFDNHQNLYISGFTYANNLDFDAGKESHYLHGPENESMGFLAKYKYCHKPVDILEQFDLGHCGKKMTSLVALNDKEPVIWYQDGMVVHNGPMYILPKALNQPVRFTVEDGCGQTDEIQVSRQERSTKFIRAYPNPALEYFDLKLESIKPGLADVHLINNLGQTVYTANKTLIDGIQDFRIPVSGIKTGLYYLRIQTECFVHTEKIIISGN